MKRKSQDSTMEANTEDILESVTCQICNASAEAITPEVLQHFPGIKPTCPACNKRYDEGERYDWTRSVWYRPAIATALPPEVQAWHEACPPAYRQTDVARADFPVESWKQVEKWQYGERGLLIHGDTATRKSRCMFLLLRRLMLDEGLSARVFFCEQWSEFVAQSCQGDEAAMNARRALIEKDLLVFDDLFAEKMSERAESLLLSTIDARLRELKPVLVTTMFTGKTAKFLDQTRGSAVLRRLREMCDVVEFKGKAVPNNPTTIK